MGDDAAAQAASLRIRTDQVGDGYDSLTDGASREMLTAARTEGLVLDPVCSGRALAGREASR